VPNLKFVALFVREILGGSQNYKIGSRDPHMTPFDPILHFFRQNSPPSLSLPNLKFLASTVREILGRGPKISKIRDSDMTPFDPTLHYVSWNSLPSDSVPNFKFLVSTVCEILGGPKSGSRDPHMTPFNLILRFLVRTH